MIGIVHCFRLENVGFSSEIMLYGMDEVVPYVVELIRNGSLSLFAAANCHGVMHCQCSHFAQFCKVSQMSLE